MDGIREAIADPHQLSLVAPAGITAFYIAVIAFNGLVGIVTQPHTMSNCAAGKTEMEGRFGWMFGNMLKRVCTIPWCLTGVAAIVYFGGKGIEIEPDKVFGAVAGDFLPKILPGVLGIFLAALLASVMSSCDAFMIASWACSLRTFTGRWRRGVLRVTILPSGELPRWWWFPAALPSPTDCEVSSRAWRYSGRYRR